MSRRFWLCLVILAVVGVLAVEPVFAEITFKWGPYLRVRHEYWKNWNDYNSDVLDNRSRFRIKTSLWGKLDVSKNTSLYAKLTNENNAYAYYGAGAAEKNLKYDINEVVFDNLYLDLKDVQGFPIDMRIGRQDLMGQYGEGFLISDGTPQDGSRTMYFDAIKATWKINKKNSFDVVYISNDRTDEKLPIINRLDGRWLATGAGEQQLNLGDERGVIVYLKSDPNKKLHLENYYINKFEEGGISTKMGAEESIINTFGTYAKYTFAPYTLKGQLAIQDGKYGDSDRSGLGGYIFLTRDFKKTKFTPTLNAGYMYLSGDDRGTDKKETWDPLFSRWPIVSDVYSELYYLSYSNESGAIGYWNNLQLWKLGVTIVPTKKTKLGLAYYILKANETVAATSTTFASGKNRGNLLTAKFDYTFNKNLSAFLQGEIFNPGDFYVDTRDDGVFVRTQVEMKF